MRKYKILNIKTIHGGAEFRVLSSEKSTANAALEQASLEDVFLYYFGEKAGATDVSI